MPLARSVPVVADAPELREWAEQLVARARAENLELTGDNGLLTAMVRQVLQTGLTSSSRSISAMNRTRSRVASRATTATARIRRP